MKMLVFVVVGLIACSKKPGDSSSSGSGSGGSGSVTAPAPPVEDVSCKVAAKEYATKMAATPGNVLSDAKPDEGLIYYTSISMEDYCVGEDGCCVPWTPEERACVKTATASTVATCFTGAALSQVNAGLSEVVTTALANRAKNQGAEPGSAAEKAPSPPQ